MAMCELLFLQNLLLKGLGRTKITFKSVSLSAILTLALRPLISANFSDKFMTIFLINIMSVPGLIHHLQHLSVEVISTDVCLMKLLFKKNIFLDYFHSPTAQNCY